MDDDLRALARCVGDIDAFAADHWGRAPLVRRSAGPFDDLLDLDAVERLLVSTARRPSFRLVRDGTTVPVETYTTSVRLGGASVDDAADVGRIAGLVAEGATVVLQGLQRTWLPLAQLCRSLERATSHAVQANAYLSPPGTPGLGRHRDTHDVLVLQVLGAKGWDVDGLGALELAAGDVLYLPAGTSHAATATREVSLHLTIGLLRETYRSALRRVVDAASSTLDLDRPLPLGYARPEQEATVREALAEVLATTAKHVDALDPAVVAGAEAERARRRRRPLWTGHLRSVLALATVDDSTRLRRRVDNPARLHEAPDEDGRLVLELVDCRLRLPPSTKPALDAVLGTDELTVADLRGLDASGRAVLARRLVRDGLLEIVDP